MYEAVPIVPPINTGCPTSRKPLGRSGCPSPRDPASPAFEHRVELAFIQVNPAVAADARRNAASEFLRELTLHRFDRLGGRFRARCADAARNYAHGPRGRDSPLVVGLPDER
jgi:hypothetical protein